MPIEFTRCVADPELKALGFHRDEYMFDYEAVSRDLASCFDADGYLVDESTFYGMLGYFGSRDLFAFSYFILDLPVNDPFVLARIYEIQHDYAWVMDLWFRGGWKSTLKTYALVLWILANDPEARIALFSNTRALAKGHMRRSKIAMETNERLKRSFPEVFYENPKDEAPRWNEDIGLYVRRKKNHLNASLEAWGLVDNMPTGGRYTHIIYDDIIDLKLVNTQDMIEKATECFRMSLLLGERKCIKTINGTIYGHDDTYHEIMKSKKFRTRIRPPEIDMDGEYLRGGKPVYFTREELDDKYDEINSEYMWNCQMGQVARGEKYEQMKRAWLEHSFYRMRYEEIMEQYITTGRMNLIGLADPGKKRERRNDYTVYWIIGTDAQRNYWMLDCVRDKMTQEQKWDRMKTLVARWGVGVWGYEHVGLAADKEYMERRMMEDGVFFQIIETNPKNVPKKERIKNLRPEFERGRILLPYHGIMYEDVNGVHRELIDEFLVDEYDTWPKCTHDDMLDDLAQIFDPNVPIIFPAPDQVAKSNRPYDEVDPLHIHNKGFNSQGWMAVA